MNLVIVFHAFCVLDFMKKIMKICGISLNNRIISSLEASELSDDRQSQTPYKVAAVV